MNLTEIETARCRSGSKGPIKQPLDLGNAERLLGDMDSQIDRIVSDAQNSDLWRAITSSSGNRKLAIAILREIHLEIFFYNAPIVEATISLIGQMPRNLKVRHLKARLRHQAEEFDHGEMALKDYIALGADEAEARARRISPQSLAAAGIWQMLVHFREPFAYLGAEYLFETLTPLICDRVKPVLPRQVASGSFGFIEFHSEEDPKHAALMKELIKSTAQQFPGSTDAMRYGFDCFSNVYPWPVWKGAYTRALVSCQ